MPKMLTKRCGWCRKPIKYTKQEWAEAVAVWKRPGMFAERASQRPAVTCTPCYEMLGTTYWKSQPQSLLVPCKRSDWKV